MNNVIKMNTESRNVKEKEKEDAMVQCFGSQDQIR